MISKIVLFIAIVGSLGGSSKQEQETALRSGLEYALTQPDVVDTYGINTDSGKSNCKKVVFVSSSKSMDKSTAAYFNESDACVIAKEKPDLFFLSIREFFEIDRFSNDDYGYTLSLKYTSPENISKSETQIFLILKYGMQDGIMDVHSFEQVAQ